MGNGEALVRALWERIEARDWDGARELLADGFEAEWPHTRERFRGRDNFVEMNRVYPEGWSIEVLDVLEGRGGVASRIRVTHPDGTFHAASFFSHAGGLLTGVWELWVEEGHEQPPAWRARFAAE